MVSNPNISKPCINFKSNQLVRALNRLYDAELAKVNLKTTQFALLAKLFIRGPNSPSKLAIMMELEKSTLTRNLQPLIKAGLLTLEMNSSGRGKIVNLTHAGRDKYIEADLHWNTAQKIILGILGSERENELYALMDESLNLIHTFELYKYKKS